MASIVVKNIYKNFGSLEVIRDVSLEVQDGEIVCLLGPSGCGKTTLLRIIAKLIPPDSGTVMNGSTFGIVFQEPRLLDWRTIEENLEIPRLLCGKKMDGGRVHQLLNMVGLNNEFSQFYPRKLSTGMQQRVAIIRALVLNPDILLLDEPFRGLDIQIRESLEDDVLLLHKVHRKSILFVTHSIEEGIRVADRIAVLSKRPMHVRDIIKMPRIPKPRDVYSAEVLDMKRQLYDYLHYR